TAAERRNLPISTSQLAMASVFLASGVVKERVPTRTRRKEAKPGFLSLRDEAGRDSLLLNGGTGAGRFCGPRVDGDVLVFSKKAPNQDANKAAVWIPGSDGDIILKNADCAEEFELAPGPGADAGTVMVIDDTGRLAPYTNQYDRTVAGVVWA